MPRRAPAVPIVWRDPPPAARGPTALDAGVPDRLRDRPGVWAMIRAVSNKNTGRVYAADRRERWGPTFEIVVRGREVFARFVGGLDDEPRTLDERDPPPVNRGGRPRRPSRES